MRELTKSMLSLSWAMSLLGLKQVAGLFTPGANTAGSFETVTRSAEDQLGPVARSTFRTGDNLQRGLVDLAFSLFTFGLWQPRGGRGNASRGGWGSGGWGPCDTGRVNRGQRDAGAQAGWGQGVAEPPSGWSQAGAAQPGAGGWSPEGLGGGWKVGGGSSGEGWSPQQPMPGVDYQTSGGGSGRP
jgi:hypothetical protein